MKILGNIKELTIIHILKYKTMQSYCLKCKKYTENINLRISKLLLVEQYYYQNVFHVIIKSQELLKFKKQVARSTYLGTKTQLNKTSLCVCILF